MNVPDQVAVVPVTESAGVNPGVVSPFVSPLNALAKSAMAIAEPVVLVRVKPAIVTAALFASVAVNVTVGLIVDVLATVNAVPVVLSFKLALATSGSLTKLTDVAAVTYAGELNPVNLPDQVAPAGVLAEVVSPLFRALNALATSAAAMTAPVVLVKVRPAIVTDLSTASAAKVTLGLPGVPSEICANICASSAAVAPPLEVKVNPPTFTFSPVSNG